MSDLIAALAPRLGALPRPNSEQVLCLPTFRANTLPQGLGQEMAEQLGIEHPDINGVFLEALLHAVDQLGYTVLPKGEVDELRTAAASNEDKRNQIKHFHTDCGTPIFRAMVRDFNTDQPRISCAVIKAVGQMSGNCATGHR